MPSDAVSTPLRDIAYHIDLASHFVAGFDGGTFKEDLRTARYPSIAWKEMAGAGNIYRHDYENVAASYVWFTVQNHLPPLRAVIERELASIG